MNTPDRHMLLGMALGAVCATALAATGPGWVLSVTADELPGPAIDTDNLVRFGDREFFVDYEDWVSTDPLSTASVKKIEAGRVSYVTITTTATGVYSSDGLTSRHVQYPGIGVEPAEPANRFAYWSDGHWNAFAVTVGDSFRYISRAAVNR
ncbi:hypothetical protein ACFSX5_13050 [Devosia albogilva]|uniref:Uncharacterized protein n=1 Tax=Devosia albogilva TaxID=429726 RepID=A0ABW5QMM9_9HYPH